MGQGDEGALERAEGFFKKVLGRIGASVDERLSTGGSAFAAHEVGALAASIERAIEAKVRADRRGVRRLAPDRFSVLLTYEDDAKLSDADRKALAGELAATAYEFVVNHRYETLARVYVEVGCDLFAKSARVEASFSPEPGESASGAARDVRPVAAGEVKAPSSSEGDYQFVGAGGKPVVRVRLEPGGDPLTVGRAAGNRLLVDHESVSKFHATVTLTRDNRLVVADLGSTNGTYVGADRSPIGSPRVVEPGSRLVFGDVAFDVQKL